VVVMIGIIILLGALALTLLVTGQTVLLAQLIVSAVLIVVFGTPTCCVLGLIIAYAALCTRSRRRARPAPAPAPDTRRAP
jgi:hypothetical protein